MPYVAKPKTAAQRACKKKQDAASKKFDKAHKARLKACGGYKTTRENKSAKCKAADKVWVAANRESRKAAKCNPGWEYRYDPEWMD